MPWIRRIDNDGGVRNENESRIGKIENNGEVKEKNGINWRQQWYE